MPHNGRACCCAGIQRTSASVEASPLLAVCTVGLGIFFSHFAEYFLIKIRKIK